MFARDQYELLDFGAGRRLERWAGMTLDRPCPAVAGLPQAAPALWPAADARFNRGAGQQGAWTAQRSLPDRWTVARGPLTFELKRCEFGQVGLFPEQAENWDWLSAELRRADLPSSERPRRECGTAAPGCVVGRAAEPDSERSGTAASAIQPSRVLNLFAYTGAATLSAAAAGAEVTHVDAAANVVAWARRNAELSGLAAAPVRWIAEDAQRFVKRELRRGARYDALILDPPSYGHGPRGEVWRLTKHLPALLERCLALTAGRPRLLLLTCHTPGYDAARLERMIAEAFGDAPLPEIASGPLSLCTAAARPLPCGSYVRCTMREAV
jgi:23S rRNA (cytosine1962-C5)-methyltransferase